MRKESISNGSKQKTENIDFFKLLNENDLSQNIRIYDNDVIIIEALKDESKITANTELAFKSNLNKKYINVYITGRVRSPGEVKISSNSSLNDATSCWRN